MTLRATVNRILDYCARPVMHWSSFLVCGAVGLTVAVAVGAGLTVRLGLSLWIFGVAVATAVATFLSLALLTKVLAGEERLVYYHHEVAILASVTTVLWLIGQPVLRYLDVTLLGVGAFLVCGRVGCFMVGCCHGRPHDWGVRYRPEHADVGFTPYFVGVRLFPVQLAESAWVFLTVAVGVGLLLRGAAPGEALAWYIVVYDLGRFGFEFLRGDPARPYRLGFSEAQCTSLLLMVILSAAELAGAVPLRPWHLLATLSLIAVMIGVIAKRRWLGDRRYRLLGARHMREVAGAVELIASLDGRATRQGGSQPRTMPVARTSSGIRISGGRMDDADGREIRHYTISSTVGDLRDGEASALTELLARLNHHDTHGEALRGGTPGTFHLIVASPSPLDTGRARAPDAG